MADLDVLLAQAVSDPAGMLAIGSAQDLLLSQIGRIHAVAIGQPVPCIHHQLKPFGEQRPCIKPVPVAVDRGSQSQFSFAVLEEFSHGLAGATQKAKLKSGEMPIDLGKKRDNQSQVDALRQRNAQRTDITALERRGQ